MAQGEKIIGIDLGTTNSVVAVMEGSEAEGDPERGRQSADAQRRRVHRQRRNAGRRTGAAAGGHQSDAHGLLDQAIHGPSAQRSRSRKRRWFPTRSRAGRTTT